MITVTIAGVDKTSLIEQRSIRYKQTLSKEPATLSFMVQGAKTMPTVGQSIVVALDAVNFFKGTITERNEKVLGQKVLAFEFNCLDGYYDMDRRLVVQAFNATTLGAVVTSIISGYTTGFTLNIPATTPTVKTARFNYEQPSRCIQKLCDSVGWDWHIDANSVVYVYPPSATSTAPYEINDTDGNHINKSLSFNRNIVELRNVVYVRGGEYLDPIASADAVDKYKANGTDNTFPLVYRYNAVQVTKNGVAQTVGVDFITDPLTVNCIYNFSEKLIKFPDGTLANGDIVRVFGNAYVPLVVQAEDSDSIVAYGTREGIEINKSVNSIEEAEVIANALIDKWRLGSKEGSFDSYKTGYQVGQTIRINSVMFGVDDTYKINRVSASMHTSGDFRFGIEFIKSGQTTFSDLLVSLIGKDRENISISENEVLQRFRKVVDTFGLTDQIVSVTKTLKPYGYGPVSTKTQATYNFGTFG